SGAVRAQVAGSPRSTPGDRQSTRRAGGAHPPGVGSASGGVPSSSMERATLTRLRWRLRGAWQWPLFAVLLAADTVLLHELPIAGDGPDWFAAAVLALFFN